MIKIYIPSVLTGADCKCFTEIFSIVPFTKRVETYQQVVEAAGYWNEGLYTRLFLNNLQHVERVDEIAHANIVILPFKYNQDDERVRTICAEAASYKKKVAAFYNDDNGTLWNLPDNLFLFRTSLTNQTRRDSERSLPVLVPDHKPTTLQLTETVPFYVTGNISFCGHAEGIREEIIHHLKELQPTFDPIIRQGFWAAGMSKVQARRDYYKNLMDHTYTLCMRGGGNFSYRFYEALSFGRIPILIDTDCVLPFGEAIDWDQYIVRIDHVEFMNMTCDEFTAKIKSKHYSPIKNRILWERFFSPEGYLDNLFSNEITYLLHR